MVCVWTYFLLYIFCNTEVWYPLKSWKRSKMLPTNKFTNCSTSSVARVLAPFLRFCLEWRRRALMNVHNCTAILPKRFSPWIRWSEQENCSLTTPITTLWSLRKFSGWFRVLVREQELHGSWQARISSTLMAKLPLTVTGIRLNQSKDDESSWETESEWELFTVCLGKLIHFCFLLEML